MIGSEAAGRISLYGASYGFLARGCRPAPLPTRIGTAWRHVASYGFLGAIALDRQRGAIGSSRVGKCLVT